AEYRVFEQIGDEKAESNPAQAFLCYQQAEFLCSEAEKCEELSVKRASLKINVPPASIVIVSYNSRKLMEDCINSIHRHCPEGSYSIIVVDNASKDGVTEYLQQQKDITLICNEENRGFPVACNQGIAAAPAGEDIFFLNNDTRITHNALFWLRMGLYESEDTGASGCVANYAGTGQMLELMLPLPENYTAYAREKNIPLPEPYEEAKILCGFAMLVRRSFIDEFGGMDEAFSPGYYEDTDLSLRIRNEGKKLRICKNSLIYHAGGKSFKERPDLDAITDRNLMLLASKWGTDFMK
nr:glycosyltransferase family 2 protein [Lachnospiraceae bacterium]